MNRLYLVQHGDATPKDVDPERALSEKGRADVARLAEWLHRQGVQVVEIPHSGKPRARQTAELLGPLLAERGNVRQEDGLGPQDSPRILLRRLRERENDTLIVSHMPLVARLVSVATTGGPDTQVVEFEPGSVAGLLRVDASWRLFLFAGPRAF